MKISSILILSLLLSYISFAQIDINALLEKNIEENLGKCFVSYPLDTNDKNIYYLQIIPAEYETYQIRIDEKFVKKQIDQKRINNPSNLDLPINTASSKTVLIKKSINCMSKIAYETGKSFCFMEIPAHYTKIKRLPIVKNGDTTYIVKDTIVDARRIIKPIEIRVYQKKKEVDFARPTYEVKGGRWSKWLELECSFHRQDDLKIIDVQRRLIELGYKIELSGVFDELTKKVLLDFQRNNNLTDRGLNIETFVALDLVLPERY
jgi:hypothetical protein